MTREVDLVSYLPPFMQSYKEPAAALEAENPEFDLIWDAANRTLYNHFIATADEYGISRYEKMLGIYPSAEDTIESRRSRVQSKWFSSVPYTWRVLLQKLKVLCRDTDFILTDNFQEGYTMILDTSLEMYGQVEELKNIINDVIPCNVAVISNNKVLCNAYGNTFFSGGVCYTKQFLITNDFNENVRIDGQNCIRSRVIISEIIGIEG